MGTDGLLRAPEAARRLGISTKEILTLAHQRRIVYVMHDGIVHFKPEVVDRYQAAPAS